MLDFIQIKNFWRQREVQDVWLLIIGVKLEIFLFSIIAVPALNGIASSHHWFDYILEIWQRWDAVHYPNLAANGYSAIGDARNLIVYFPFYPILIRGFSPLAKNYQAAALLISNIASLMGLWLFYLLARFDYDIKRSYAALLVLMLFPTAFFFNAPYTESLFLLLSVGAFYLARRRRWAWAGVAGGLAALTRITGILLFLALCVEFYDQWRARQQHSLWEGLWLALVPIFFSFYLLINHIVQGNPLAFLLVIDDHWNKHLAWPWESLSNALRVIGTFPVSNYGEFFGVGEVAAGVFLVAMTVAAFRYLRLSYALFIAQVTLVTLSTSFLMSTPRYVLSAFPIFFLLGGLNRRPAALVLWLIFSTLLLSLLTAHYVMGWWAY